VTGAVLDVLMSSGRFRPWMLRQKRCSNFSTPPHIHNRALSNLFASEARFLRTRSLPFGVSLIALGRKAGG
jgi:hypothetical protein